MACKVVDNVTSELMAAALYSTKVSGYLGTLATWSPWTSRAKCHASRYCCRSKWGWNKMHAIDKYVVIFIKNSSLVWRINCSTSLSYSHSNDDFWWGMNAATNICPEVMRKKHITPYFQFCVNRHELLNDIDVIKNLISSA